MYIITDHDDVAICKTEDLGYKANGDLIVKGGAYYIARTIVKNIYGGIESAPVDYADFKYRFDGLTWTRNDDYAAPISFEMYEQLRADIDFIAVMEGLEL